MTPAGDCPVVFLPTRRLPAGRRAWGLLAAAMLALAGGAARADDVRLASGLNYAGVTVVGVDNATLVFEFQGQRIAKPLTDTASIRLDGQDAYNDAEALLDKKDYTSAAGSLAGLAKAAPAGPVRDCALRSLYAWDKAARNDEAVLVWLSLAREKPTAGVLAARPTTLAEKGQPPNAAAIRYLEGELPRIGDDSKLLHSAVQAALIDLYRREDQTDKAVKMLQQLTEQSAQAPAEVPGGARPGEAAPGESVTLARLKVVGLLVDQGKAQEALDTIGKDLRAYGADECRGRCCYPARRSWRWPNRSTRPTRSGTGSSAAGWTSCGCTRTGRSRPRRRGAAAGGGGQPATGQPDGRPAGLPAGGGTVQDDALGGQGPGDAGGLGAGSPAGGGPGTSGK